MKSMILNRILLAMKVGVMALTLGGIACGLGPEEGDWDLAADYPNVITGKGDSFIPTADPSYELHYQRLMTYLDAGWSLQHVAALEFTHDFDLPKNLGECHILGKSQAFVVLQDTLQNILDNEDSQRPEVTLGWAMARFNELMGQGDLLHCTRTFQVSSGNQALLTVYRGLNSGFKLKEYWEFE